MKLYHELIIKNSNLYCVFGELNSQKRYSSALKNIVSIDLVKEISSQLNIDIIEVSTEIENNEIITLLVMKFINKTYQQIPNKSKIDINIGLFGFQKKTDVVMKFAKKKAKKKKEDNQYVQTLDIDFKKVQFNIIDVPDCSENDLISYFNQVQGYILFFDISSRSSMYDLKQLFIYIKSKRIFPLFIIISGLNSELKDTKKPQKRLIEKSEIDDLSKLLKCLIIETSIKTGENISEIFTTLARNIIYNIGNEAPNDIQIGKKFSDIKGDWNIGLVDIDNSDADLLARKFILGEFSDSQIATEYTKIYEACNVTFPLTLHISKYGFDDSFFNKVQGIIFVININSLNDNSYDEIVKICNHAKEESGEDFIGIIAANHC